jgi:hypothetical protein
MSRPLPFALSLLATIALSSCESGGIVGPVAPGGPITPLPPAVSVTGAWQGEAISPFGSVREITFVLQQFDFKVAGRSSMIAPTGEVYFVGEVDGFNTFPEVSFTLRAPQYQPMTARGRLVDRETMALVLEGGGWDGTPVTLRRE